MPSKKITLEEMENAAQKIRDTIAGARIAMLEQMADLQGDRAARLIEVGAKLQAELGSKDPRVVEFKNAAASAAAFQAAFKQTAEREAHVPRVKQHEWLIFGQVLDQKGKPLAGLRVRVLDRDSKYVDLPGDTTTNEHGDFSVVYQAADFAETGEKLPDLYVTVLDASGKTLYSSRDNVRFEAGKSEYFAIRLGKASKAAEKKSAPAPKTGKRKS
jgi:hypothetical protein